MGFSAGIVGLPNVGKSTLFNVLTRLNVPNHNYPFCTVEPNVGFVEVPDERLQCLKRLLQPDKTIPAMVKFVDIAGLVRGASSGEGLGNQFLSHVKSTHAIVHVTRLFENADVTHVLGKPDPARDLETIFTELLLKDIEFLEKQIENLRKKSIGVKASKETREKLLVLLDIWNQGGGVAKRLEESSTLCDFATHLSLLAVKPGIVALNIGMEQIDSWRNDLRVCNLLEKAEEYAFEVIPIPIRLEEELCQLPEEERMDFLADFNLQESGLNILIRKGFDLLNLLTFFTAGKKETRAWTLPKGSGVLDAAECIHSDFKRGFICAEVIDCHDFILAGGSRAKIREEGKMRLEGKNYVMQEGDVVNIRFNV